LFYSYMLYTISLDLPNWVKRIAIGLLGVGAVWLVCFGVCFYVLNDDVSIYLHAHQQETAQQRATSISQAVESRFKALDALALQLSVPVQQGAAATLQYVAQAPLSPRWFNGGVIVYDKQGVPIAQSTDAQYDAAPNGFYSDYVASALQHGHRSVGPPEIHSPSRSPSVGMVVPILNPQGQVVGALQGLTLLAQPHFLQPILHRNSVEDENFYLIDPLRRLVIYTTDRDTIFQPLPLQGVQPALDSLLAKALPTFSAASASQEPLASSHRITHADWILLAEPPGTRGLIPMQNHQPIKSGALAVLLVAGSLLMVWFFKDTLLPLHHAKASLAQLLKGRKRWIHNTPTARSYEAGEIIGSVNQLLSTLGQGDLVLPQIDYFAKSLADNMPDVVGYWSADLRCSYANSGCLEWFGRSPEQMKGIHLKTLLGEQLFMQNEAQIHAVLKGENQQFERDFVQPNGKRRNAWVQYMAHKVHGIVQGFFVFMVDVTQVKKQTSVARISDAALKAISQGIFIADAKQKILLVNDAFSRITGYDKNEVLGQSYHFLHGDLTDTLLLELMARALRAGQSFSGELINYRKDGSTFWNDITISPVHDEHGHMTHLTGVVRDVSERKQSEYERLRAKMVLERDALNHTIVHSLPWDLAVIDRSRQVLALNHSSASLGSDAGRQGPHDPLFPKTEGTYFLDASPLQGHAVWGSYREQLEHGLHAILAGECNQFQLEYPSDDSPQPRWSNIIITPLGADRQAVIVARQEITDLKNAYFEIKAAHGLAEKANHAKSHFLATASHDLRQPLSALSLYVGVLNKNAAPEQKELVNNIRGCVDSLSELLEDLLDMSKLDAGVVQPHWVDCSIDELLASQVTIHSVNARIKGLELRMRPSGAVVHCDTKLLGRLVGNLVTNAIRYTQHGGVLMTCRQHEGAWWLQVWDTGIGIPEDKHALIFEEFQQLNPQERTQGSGLGLAIVAKIASLLQLEVRLHSRPGRGSLFAVKLATAQSVPVLAPVALPSATPPALRMAVIDDDTRVLRAMVMALQGVGHEVIAAPDATQLLQQLGDIAPQIIISDYRLGAGRTGFDAIEAVRQQFNQPDLPAILVTGDTDPTLLRSMADQGIAVHFKPLKIDTLQVFIKESIERISP
jgi:PAS domain S-box-containing protein